MRIPTLVTTLGFALVSTTAKAQTVTYDYDKGADISRIRTYAWTRGTNVKDELNDKRIVAAIDAQLAVKGLTMVEATANPDMLVASHAAFDRDLQINAFSSDWGGGWRFGSNRTGTARTQEIVNGTLVVDLVDAKSGSMLWRGMAKREVDMKASPEKRDRNLNKAAEKMFKHYPPEAK